MSEPQAQRTLVKSPPELWAEISDVEALSRHLGAFGAIRITRLDPETTVAWEGNAVRGTVELKASGWGTKVTLTAVRFAETEEPTLEYTAADLRGAATAPASAQQVQNRYMGPPPPAIADTEEPPSAAVAPAAPPAAEVTVTPDAAPAPSEVAASPDDARSEAAAQPRAPAEQAPEKRTGLLARLRAWFSGPSPTADAPLETVKPAADAQASPETGQPAADAHHPLETGQPAADAHHPLETGQPAADPPPELPAAVEPPEGEPLVTAACHDDDAIVGILTGVLDELGFAHHRPFSRG